MYCISVDMDGRNDVSCLLIDNTIEVVFATLLLKRSTAYTCSPCKPGAIIISQEHHGLVLISDIIKRNNYTK